MEHLLQPTNTPFGLWRDQTCHIVGALHPDGALDGLLDDGRPVVLLQLHEHVRPRPVPVVVLEGGDHHALVLQVLQAHVVLALGGSKCIADQAPPLIPTGMGWPRFKIQTVTYLVRDAKSGLGDLDVDEGLGLSCSIL